MSIDTVNENVDLDLSKTFFDAVLKGDLIKVEECLDKGMDINVLDELGVAAIYYASFFGKLELVNLLISKGAYLEPSLPDGETPLYVAAFKGNLEIVKSLVKAGANIEVKVDKVNTPIFIASHFQHKDVVEFLLDSGAKFLDIGQYPIMVSQEFRKAKNQIDQEIHQLIIKHYLNKIEEYKKDLNGSFQVVVSRFNEDISCLFKEFSNEDIIIYNKGKDDLVNLPANINVIKLPNVGREAHTYLTHIYNNYSNLADRTLFIQGYPYEHPLLLPLIKFKDAGYRACENIIAYCQSGEVIRDTNKDLKEQIARKKYNHLENVDDFITFVHSYIDKDVSEDETIFSVNGAQFAVDKDVILRNERIFYKKLLIPLSIVHPIEGYYFERSWDLIFRKHNYNPDLEELNTNLINYAWNGDFNNFKLYLELGADINYRYLQGANALYIASKKCHIDIIRHLIDEGAILELSTDDGATPLHSAIVNNCNEGAEILLNAGINPDLKWGNHVALNGAIQNKNIEGVKLLLNAGAKITFDEYYTPLMNAAFVKDKSSENQEIYDLVLNNYWKQLEQFHQDNKIISNKSFEVVIVRYKEDLSWVSKEFLTERVIIYNKGPDDLVDLPPNCEVRKIENLGFLGGTYLYHIVNNYDNLADRTLFIQGMPYDQEVILPLVRNQLDIENNCKNILAKCQNTTITKEAEELIAYSEEEWMTSKYNRFEPIEYDMYHFAHHFVNPNLDDNAVLKMALGAQMAVDKLKILTHSKDYYQTMLKEFERPFPRQDFFLEKLWDEVFEPSDFLCHSVNIIDHRINQFLQEGFVFTEEKRKVAADARVKLLNLDKIESNELKVPLFSHQVYFTNINNPKEIDFVSLNKTIHSLNNLNQANENWHHYLWTNYPEIIQNEIVNIKNLEVLKYDNNYIYNITDSFLGDLSARAIESKFYSEASDMVRYAALMRIGGMYRDLDYEIYKAEGITRLLYHFNFVAGTEFDCPYSIFANGFIINNPGHPVISKIIEQIYRNKVERVDLPDYIKYPCNNMARVVFETGPVAFTVAYFSVNNINGNNDIIMPNGILYNTNYSRSTTPTSRCYNPGLEANSTIIIDNKEFELLGADMNCGNWYAGNLDDILYKKNSNIYLTKAAFEGNIDLVKWSLDNGANIDYQSPEYLNTTALYLAVQGEYYEIVKLLLERGANKELLTKSGSTPLHYALQGGNNSIINLLLEYGANPNNKKLGKYSSAFLAIHFNNLEALKSLVLKGAIIDDELEQLQNLAKDKSHTEILEFLNNYSIIDENYNIFDVVSKSDSIALDRLIKKGVDVNQKQDNKTPLLLAVIKRDYNIAKLLIDNGAELQLDDHNSILRFLPQYQEDGDNNSPLVELIINKYFTYLDSRNSVDLNIDNDKFEVVVVRYKEDLHWIEKEFGRNIKITIYNKGSSDLDYLPDSYKVISSENMGYLGGSYLKFITDNYPNFASRVLFLQGWPYDSWLGYFPLIKYSYMEDYNCPNLIGDCTKFSMNEEENSLVDFDWENTKYKNFTPGNYTLKTYAQEFIDKNNYDEVDIWIPYRAIFAVDRRRILDNDLFYYNKRLPLFAEKYPVVDHFQERLWNEDFYVKAKSIYNTEEQAILDSKLIDALERKDFNLAEILVIRGANIDYVKQILSASHNILEEYFNLLEKKKEAHINDLIRINGVNLIDAAQKGNIARVEYYLNKGADINYHSDATSLATALFMAVQENHFDIVKLLLSRGADLEIAAINGVTPVHRAAQDNSLDILRSLLEYGASPNTKNDRGMSAIYVAEYLKLNEIYDLLVEFGAVIEKSDYAIDRLENAIYRGKFNVVDALLKSGITIYLDKRHPTLSLVAKDYYLIHSYKKYVDSAYNILQPSIKTALELGLDLNAKFTYGLTFLFLSLLKGDEELFMQLLQNGADPDLLTEQGYSLLTIASYLNKNNIIQSLLDHNASPNLDQARLPIFAATYQGNYDIVSNLLTHKAWLNSNRVNPIFTALSFHHPKYGKDERLYNLVMEKYFNQTAEINKNLTSLNNDKFEVVVVRYNEDLHWIEKEFGSNIKATIYNKGEQDLDYLPSGYNIVNTPNVGYLGGTYLLHIAKNYPNFADRVLFLQGWPYDSALLKLPMLQYSYTSETTCLSVIGDCIKTSINQEDLYLTNIDWERSKYVNFGKIKYNMTSYAKEFVNKSIDGSDVILAPYAALFAVEKDKILANPIEYYANRLEIFAVKYPMVDHFQERLWDLDFYNVDNSLKLSYLENIEEVRGLGDSFIAGYMKIDDYLNHF